MKEELGAATIDEAENIEDNLAMDGSEPAGCEPVSVVLFFIGLAIAQEENKRQSEKISENARFG